MNDVNIEKALQTIRFLSADGVQVANSGHPGLPMGAAAMAYTIWMRHLKHNPRDPKWANRDRFVLSGGHGSMLLYTLLYLTGYEMSVDDLKQFRQWGSKTPGHPEYGHTVGVETTTGPLGQGFANGVGMAIAEAHLAAEFNQPDHKIVDHYTYAIVTDGDLMEGISSEAASLAGHLKLGKLIYLYDDNHISIEGSTDVTFTEDRGKRFEAYGWHVQTVADGNDVEAIDQAIIRAKADERPSLILCRTTIGYGLPTKAGSAGIHGSPAGWDELNKAKELVGWPTEPLFYTPTDVLTHFRGCVDAGDKAESEWQQTMQKYTGVFPVTAAELQRRLDGTLPESWQKKLPEFPADVKGLGSRVSSGKVLNAIADALPELFGGSADLAPSNNTWMERHPAFSPEELAGRNIHFGVREHGMAAVANGIYVHGGFIPYAATFLVFSDYMRGALRVAALSKMGTIFILTHDSIGVGEDGPTHQPIEQVMSLRLIPGMVVLRPGDANEVSQSWKFAIEHRHQPTALVLSRQNLPTLDRSKYASADGLDKGAYILLDCEDHKPDVILMASGSEVSLIVDAADQLIQEGIKVRLVSFPSWELFKTQSAEYRQTVLPTEVKNRLAVEAGVTIGWERWVGEAGAVIGIDHFGTSAPGDIVMKEFGFSVENVIATAKTLLRQ
ncbi:MAG: transketolase [Anaerolineaceae bacterium]